MRESQCAPFARVTNMSPTACPRRRLQRAPQPLRRSPRNRFPSRTFQPTIPTATRSTARRPRISVAAHQTDELALDLDPIGSENPRLVSLIGGLQRNRRASATKAFEGCFLLVDERHDDVARIGV